MKKILSFVLILCGLICFSFSAITATALSDSKYKYKDIVLPMAYERIEMFDEGVTITNYNELYEYFSNGTPDEETPDFVLVSLSANIISGQWEAAVFDDYIMRTDEGAIPYRFGYGIYVPKENNIYSLTEAYKSEIEGIMNVFTEAGLGELIGDMDKDRDLTIKDATSIQKCLAGLDEFENDEIWAYIYNANAPINYISDFNRDGERNIKDATAIQKHIAGLEY